MDRATYLKRLSEIREAVSLARQVRGNFWRGAYYHSTKHAREAALLNIAVIIDELLDDVAP